MKARKLLSMMLATLLVVSLAACGGNDTGAPSEAGAPSTAEPAAPAEDGDGEEGGEAAGSGEGYKIAWSTIYLTPTWQQQTMAMLEARADYWKEQGVVSEFTVANADGDVSQQISQIDNLIVQGYDAIIIVAGSATSLNNVVEKAHDKGVVVTAFDSLPTTDNMTSKINTSQEEYGALCARWIVDKLDGEGKVIVFNGPAGVAVSDERRDGAFSVLDEYPGIEVLTELNSEYNEGPARDAIMPALDAYSEVEGIIALGGSQASASLKALQEKNMDLIPITGENYNAFLLSWADLQDEGFSSFCVGQPNWLGVLAMDQAIRALNGEDVAAYVEVPIPVIDDNNLAEYVPNDYPEDGFPVKDITEEQINEYLS